MTDKEIVQALRCCKFGVPCEKCPVVGNKDCFEEVNTAAADLIERLTAENAALREKQRWVLVIERIFGRHGARESPTGCHCRKRRGKEARHESIYSR